MCFPNKCYVVLICFLTVMITPASGDQISSTTHENSLNSSINDYNPVSTINKGIKNSKKITTCHNKKSPANKKSANYSKTIAQAAKLLPIMEQTYKNNSKQINMAKKSLSHLKNEKQKANKKLEKLKYEIENYELTTKNTQHYKDLKKEYKEYKSLIQTLETTKTSANRMNGILNQQQKYTKNCIVALKQIEQSKNIPNALSNYKKKSTH